jgi:cell division protein FtsL
MRLQWVQAYRQAPWRKQAQWMGLVLLGLISLVLVASIYLTVSGQTAAEYVRVTSMQYQIEQLEMSIADQQSQLADLTSSGRMEERAADLGYEQADPLNSTYVTIPGYSGRSTRISRIPVSLVEEDSPMLRPSYTESLWDVLFVELLQVDSQTELNP